MVYLSLLHLIILFSPIHIGEVAEYTYYMEDNEVHLLFMVDLDELESLKTDLSCDYSKMLSYCTSNYINNNSTLFVNEIPIEFELESSNVRNKHLYIYFNSVSKLVEVDKVSVYNNCFYYINPNFKNRVIIDFENYRASYLLVIESKNLNCLIKDN